MGSKHGTAPTWRGECLHARRARRTSRCRRSEGGTVPQACAAGDRAPELPTPPRPCSLVQRSRMPDGLGQAMILRSSHPCLGTLFDHRGQRCEVSASNAPLTSAHRGTGSWSVRPIPRPSPPEWGSRWAPASGSKPWGGPTPSSCRRGATANTMQALLESLRRAHCRGARIISVCTGAFVLAAAGLLDGRRATTHWMYTDQLACRYPNVKVDPGVLYVDDGNILTSAGTAAGIDLCLHVVRLDYGAEAANIVARRMVVPPHRDGGQAQFVNTPVPELDADDLFADTVVWAQAHLDEPLSINDMAARAAMSPRTFARRFQDTNGTTPDQWLPAAGPAGRAAAGDHRSVDRPDCGSQRVRYPGQPPAAFPANSADLAQCLPSMFQRPGPAMRRTRLTAAPPTESGPSTCSSNRSPITEEWRWVRNGR